MVGCVWTAQFELTGLLTVDGKVKVWGQTFRRLSHHYAGRRIPQPKIGSRPKLDWDACLTSANAANQFRADYVKAFLADRRVR